MSRLLSLLLVLIITVCSPLYAFAASKTEWLYLLKDGFAGDSYKILTIRTDTWHKGELWIVEYGVGCSSMWRFEDKLILATYSTWLEGIGGKLILPIKGNTQTCRIWDAKNITEMTDQLTSEDWEWLSQYGYVGS